MSLPDPPTPAVGMRNALASSPTSANISQLAASSYHLSHPKTALHFSPSAPVVTAHAAGSDDLFATVLNQVLVFTDVRSRISVSSPGRLHIEAQDLSVARLPCGAAMAAIAGYDGVFVSRLFDRQATAPAPLLGSNSYPCVTVAVSEEGAVAAGSMAGQIALWSSPCEEACAIIGVPVGVESCDRLTQVRFVDGGIIAAWWSGLVLRYAIHKGEVTLVWKLDRTKRGVRGFSEFSGTFFVIGQGMNGGRAIMTLGDGNVYFVDLATGTSHRQTLRSSAGRVFVKGLCVSADGAFLWIRDSRHLFQIDWPEKESSGHVKTCAPVCPTT